LQEPVRAFAATPVDRTNDCALMLGDAVPPPSVPPHGAAWLASTLAVLPIEVDEGAEDHARRCVADMLTDAVIAVASRDSRLRVLSKLTTQRLALADDATTYHRLNLHYLLRARMRALRGSDTIAWELSDAQGGAVVWANVQSAANLADGAAVLAAALPVVEGFGSAILADQILKAQHLPLPTLPSHALLAGGVTLMHRFGRDDFERARGLLEALVERAPRHAAPHAWLARWHVFRVVQGWSHDLTRDRQQAQDRCRRALDLDDNSPLALTIAGSVEASLTRSLETAQTLYQRAIELNPSEPLARLLLGTAKAFQGHGEEAVQQTTAASALSPLDPMRFLYDTHAAGAHLVAGDYASAIALAQRSLRANRQHPSTYRSLAIAQVLSGEVAEARRTAASLLAIEPGFTVSAFLARSPGARFAHGQQYAQALREAGVPA
jgi:tetratricopeptide (TPR) repeat protein